MVGRPDDSDWSGALRLGISNVDPNSLKTCLPKYACPDLITKDGFWARPIKEELAKEKTRYIPLFKYRTRAIVSRGLYIFTPFFNKFSLLSRRFFEKILSLCMANIQELFL